MFLLETEIKDNKNVIINDQFIEILQRIKELELDFKVDAQN